MCQLNLINLIFYFKIYILNLSEGKLSKTRSELNKADMSLETSNANANEKIVTILIQVNALENSRQSIAILILVSSIYLRS